MGFAQHRKPSTLWDLTGSRWLFVRLEAEDGVVGSGEATPSSRYGENVASASAFFANINPQRLSFEALDESFEYLHGLSNGDFAAKAAIDVALFDGAGRKLSKPVYDLLGCGFTEKKHARAITIGVDHLPLFRQKVLEASSYPALIIKLGTRWDRQMITASRECAPNKPLRVDVNEGWKTKEEALRKIEWLAENANVECVEQPMPASTKTSDLLWLRQRSPLPLIADESFLSIRDLERCAECYHGVNAKLAKLGGISKTYYALQAARQLGLKTMIGCMLESSLLGTAAAHLCEMADYNHFDGNLLITNDPYSGVTTIDGFCSFASSTEPYGLRVV